MPADPNKPVKPSNPSDNKTPEDSNKDNNSGDSNKDNNSGDSNKDNNSGDSNKDNNSGDSNKDNNSGDSNKNKDNNSGDSNKDNNSGDSNKDNNSGDSNNDSNSEDSNDDNNSGDSNDDNNSGDSNDDNNSGDSNDDNNSEDSNDDNNSEDSNDDNNSEELDDTITTGVLKVKVIDGYMKGVPVCVVDDTEPLLPCDDRFSPSGETTEYTTNDNGEIEINLTEKRTDILKQKGFVKFKAAVPKGTTDNIFGYGTLTDRDFMLVGTKYFDEDTFDSQITDDAPAFVVSPFTTIAEIVLRNKESSAEIYKATVDTITASLGIDNTVMTDITATDYGTPELCGDDEKKAQCIKALIAGETLVRTGYIPQPEDTEKLDMTIDAATIAEELETRVKPMVNYITEMDEITPDNIAAYLAAQRYQYETLSAAGIANDWRCAVNRLSEAVCWGNNAWNNLGDPAFTEEKKSTGTYSGGNNDNLMYLVGNYSATPRNVKIRNPQVTDTTADDYYVNLTGVSKVVTGNEHACAITHYGEVYCWGSNSSSQLGLGSAEYKTENMNVDYASKVVTGEQGASSGHLSHVVDLSLGVDHSCALTFAGDIYCWGDNTAQELGDAFESQTVRPIFTVNDCNGDITDKIKIVTDPVRVPAGDVKFRSITKSGFWAHCALSTEETTDEEGHNLWCWGNDVGGMVTNRNRELYPDVKNYAENNYQVIFESGTCDVISAYPGHIFTNRYWYYYDIGYKGREWPMFGHKITNVKGIRDSFNVCDGEQCTHASFDTSDDDYDKLPESYMDDDWNTHQLSQNLKIVDTFLDIKHVAAIDIISYPTTSGSSYDTAFCYVTADNNNKLFVVSTDNGVYRNKFYDYISGVRNTISVADITDIATNQNGYVFVLTNENKMYGFPSGPAVDGNQYGLTSALAANEIVFDFDGAAPSINAVSVNQRSACALVSDTASANDSNTLWCWGSNTFGQTGSDEYQTRFSFGEAQEAWRNPWDIVSQYGNNEFYDNSDSYDNTPKKVQWSD
ncbi:RCC1 domain-containing protein [Succinimonas amylolytica]|uniref:RCC1 domain-containing protein n=1 Tax=Succinimonas amylolytica TaxID=83769 RepID=UPI0023A7DF98